MAGVTPDFNLKINFMQHEFRLVTLALAGKLREDKDIEAAKVLAMRLLAGERRKLVERLAVVEGAIDKATQEALSPAPVDAEWLEITTRQKPDGTWSATGPDLMGEGCGDSEAAAIADYKRLTR